MTPDQQRQIDDLFAEFERAGIIECVGVDERGRLVYRGTGRAPDECTDPNYQRH
jgi:hypothetical protein